MAAAAAAALLLAACRDSPSATRRTGPPPGTSTVPATTAVPPTTAPPPAPAAGAPSCPPTPARPEPSPSRPRYGLTVDIRPAEGAVTGSLAVRFTPDLPTDRLVFRLWPNGPRMARAGAALETGQVTIDGRATGSALENPTTLVVPLGRTLAAGASVEARLPWQLRLPGSSDDRVSRTGDAVRLGSFFPILAWEPGAGWVVDPPTTGFAEASTATVADFDMTVTVPPGLGVLASGVPDGRGGWKATAMRDVAISVGRFALARATANAPDPIDVTVGVHEGVGVPPQPFLQKVVRALEDFGRRFGPYPWPTYTLAITPELGGGIEYPSHVMQGPATLGRTTSHEVAHQWFYGLVGNNQGRDPWLDEGLATYAEWRFEGTLAAKRDDPIPAAARGRVGEPMSFWDTQSSVYFVGVYDQGAQALAALGDPNLVDCALRLHAAVNAHRVARPADALKAFHAVFPDAPAVLARYGVKG